MKKHFCDLCEKPASEERLEVSVPWGEEWRYQPAITARIEFGFKLREDGFAGPPDLCLECKVKLAEQIVREYGAH